MSLSIGIIGLPNVGKSTLFNALTKNSVLAANYPFATIDPNVGVVGVPDSRLPELATVYPGAPIVPADVRFTDIAGLVAGASKGEGLGNKFLANVRETAAIAHVVRAFTDTNVAHVDDNADPKRDIETIHTELVLADLDTVAKRIESITKTVKADPSLRYDLDYLEKLQKSLNDGVLSKFFIQDNPYDKSKISHDTQILINQLLTAKPAIFVFNVDESTLQNEEQKSKLAALTAPENSVFICAKVEAELQSLDAAEAAELLAELGQNQSGLAQLIHAGFEALRLQSFFTAGEKEVRAWTIPAGATAPQAAGVIHGDFERGFIAAEIINWQDLVAAGSKTAARASGKLRTEGKTYVMSDGDVAEFRFNV